MEGKLKYIDSDTAVHEILNKRPAEVVTYSDTTVANALTNFSEMLDGKQNKSVNLTALNNLGSETGIIFATSSDTLTTSPISSKVQKVLSASDIEKFRGIIQAPAAETFLFDETEQIHWTKVGSPTISANNAKFSKALQCSSGNYAQSKETITFGGDPFTVDAWLYYVNDTTSSGTNKSIFNLGNFKISAGCADNGWKGLGVYDSSNGILVWINTISSATDSLSLKKLHLEICYSSGTLYFFINGSLTKTLSRTISRAARQIILGGATCSISEFRILDGRCLHTSNFSVPTAQYILTADTVSLLHFGESY